MGTHYRGRAAEVAALDGLIKLLRAANSVSARVHRHLAPEGLTESQFGALEALHHLGPLCQKDLSAKLLKSGANMTTVVDNLEKRGLVRRERGATDRRFVTVSLTEAGQALIARVFPRHVAAVTEEFRCLEPAELEQLGRLCRKVGRQGESEPGPGPEEEEPTTSHAGGKRPERMTP